MNSSTGSLFQVASDVQVEVELYETMTEREKYDNFADLYSIIMATDYLEKAYAGDAITRQEVSVLTISSRSAHTAFLLNIYESIQKNVIS